MSSAPAAEHLQRAEIHLELLESAAIKRKAVAYPEDMPVLASTSTSIRAT
jgi:hypothetical protein